MRINVAKTGKPEQNDAKVNMDGQVIEIVKSFIYLGSEFTWDNDCSKDIRRRINLATAVYSELQSTPCFIKTSPYLIAHNFGKC